MNNLDKQYQALLQDILDNGVTKQDRTGTGTLSTFGRQIRHNMKEGFPLLTTKKMYFKGIVTELLWFLRGDTNIKFLVDNDCHIWDGDAHKNYCKKVIRDKDVIQYLKSYSRDENDIPTIELYSKEEFINKIKTDDEFAKKWGDLGPVYGKQWRSWGKKNVTKYDLANVKGSDQPKVIAAIKNGEDVTKYGVKIEYQNNSVDQIANLIRDLKTNPDSRRLMVSAWNVGELDQMTLPPCHMLFQFFTRELSLDERKNIYDKSPYVKDMFPTDENGWNSLFDDYKIPTRAISLMWNQRSVDTFLGLPFNIASYGLLLEIIAKEVNMVPDELIGNLGDTHLYLNHIEQAKEQIGRELTYDEKVDEARRRFGFDHPEGFRTFDINTKESIEFLQSKQYTREPYPLPKLVINDEFWNPDAGIIEQINHIEVSDFYVTDYQSHPTIKAPLSN